ncbi:MAG TPA: ATP-binding cassette domain-containing protein [Pyrinomonadaceae bacterium]
MATERLQPPAIEFRHVSLWFDEQQALDDISFELARGEMMFLTGASASGKSVLTHLAMGLLKPDEGQIFIEGKEIVALDESELVEMRGRGMGIVFQEDSLFTGLTAYDNAAFRLDEHGVAEDETERAVLEVLRFVGLEQDAEKFPEELSGGMRRRLEIARALIGWPSIMLFDEPTSSLDPLSARKVLDLIIRARDIQRISSIYVTKQLNEIPYLATHRAVTRPDGTITIDEASSRLEAPGTRVMVLDAGRIVFTGSVAEFEASTLPVVTRLTQADNGTEFSDFYTPDPWDKGRRPKETILGR